MKSRVLLLGWGLALGLGLWVALSGGGQPVAGSGPSSPGDGPTPVPTPGPGIQQPSASDAYCLTCHSDQSLKAGFSDGRSLSLYVDARALRDSAHGLMSCVTCHSDYPVRRPGESRPLGDYATYQTKAIEMCGRCHEAAAQGYAGSAHWQPVFAEGKGASCSECHSEGRSGHTVAATSDTHALLGPQRVGDTCGRCHQEALNSYRATSHGKVAQFGDATTTATCTTCHNDHAVKAVQDPGAPLAPQKLAAVCASCHSGAGSSFAAAWPGHSNAPPSRTAAGYGERIAFILTAAILAFGLVHVSLDFLRRLTDRNHRTL